MEVIFALVILVICLRSYVNFRCKMKYFKTMSFYLDYSFKCHPNTETALSLSTALIQTQKYKDAHSILNKLINLCPDHPEAYKIKNNMNFCKSPIPGLINKPKNFNQVWWLHILLGAFGRRQYILLKEDDYLMTNTIMRRKKKY